MAHHYRMLFLLKALEPADRKSLVNVTRWFDTCINQPQFQKVLGKISLCEKMVPVTPKPAAASNATANAAAATSGSEPGNDRLIHVLVLLLLFCFLSLNLNDLSRSTTVMLSSYNDVSVVRLFLILQLNVVSG